MSVKRYNESEGTNKRRRKDPLLQNQEDKITVQKFHPEKLRQHMRLHFLGFIVAIRPRYRGFHADHSQAF